MEGMNFWLKLMKDQKTEKISKNEDLDQNGRKVNKPRRAIRCVSQAEIVVFGGFSLMLTDGRTDGRTDGHTDGHTDGRTDPFIEMRGRI